MGTVIPIKKWNIDTNEWTDASSLEAKKRALSIVTYEDVVNSLRREEFHYIIIASGYRVENLTNNPKKISDKRNNINKVIDYFMSKRGNYRIEQILVDNDAPLREQSKVISSYIDELARQKQVASISFLGFSKCGAMGIDMLKYFRDPRSFIKTNLYSISTPYTGTIIASPRLLERKVKEIFEDKLGKSTMTKKTVKEFMKLYYSHFSNSHMDLDVAVPDGIKRCMTDVYDASFLGDLFSVQNMDKIRLVNSFMNVCTFITPEVRTNALKTADFTTIGLCMLDEYLQDGLSDGIVTLAAQKEINEHITVKNMLVPSSHNSLGNEEGRTMILSEVYKTIRRI